MLEILDFAGNY